MLSEYTALEMLPPVRTTTTTFKLLSKKEMSTERNRITASSSGSSILSKSSEWSHVSDYPVLSNVPASADQRNARPISWINWGGNRFSSHELEAVRKVRGDNLERIKQGIKSPMARSLSQHIMLGWDDRFRNAHPKAKSATAAMRKVASGQGQAPLLDRMMWKVSNLASSQGCSVQEVLVKLFQECNDGTNHAGREDSLSMDEFIQLMESALKLKFRREEAHTVFTSFDIDRNGKITLDELLHAPAGYAAANFCSVASDEKRKIRTAKKKKKSNGGQGRGKKRSMLMDRLLWKLQELVLTAGEGGDQQLTLEATLKQVGQQLQV
jgi:hypothetical protein